MTELLIQFKSKDIFGSGLEKFGTYKDANEAIKDALSLWDETIENVFLKENNKYLRLTKNTKI